MAARRTPFSTGRHPVRRAAAALFVALLAGYALLAQGRVESQDEWQSLATAESLRARGSFALPPNPAGRRYSRYSALPPLLGVGPRAVAHAALGAEPGGDGPEARDAREPDARDPTRAELLLAATAAPTAAATAATAALLLGGLVRLGVGPGAALATAAVYGLGTLALAYANSLFSQPLAALGLAGLVLGLAAGAPGAAAAALAGLLAVRVEWLALAPVTALFVWRHAAEPRRWGALLGAGALAGVAAHALENGLRGDPWLLGDYGRESFLTPLGLGLHGLLLAPGKGLLWFSPAAVLGLACLPRLLRAAPGPGFLVGGTAATGLAMVAAWWTWHGGASVGPRLLLPLLPVLVLPLAWVFAGWARLAPARRVALACVVAASVAIQLWIALSPRVGWSADAALVWAAGPEPVYRPQASFWLREGRAWAAPLWLRLWEAAPGARLAVAAGVLALAGAAGLGAAVAWRTLGLSLRPLRPLWREERRAWGVVALGLVVLAAPALPVRLLTPDRAPESAFGQPLPAQLRRLALDPQARALRGRLYLPVSGRYALAQHGPYRRGRLSLGGLDVTGTRQRPWHTTPPLAAGFHELVLASGGAGGFNALHWTVPAKSYDRTPIPRLYLAGPGPRPADGLAIRVAHARWWVLALAAVLGLFAATRR